LKTITQFGATFLTPLVEQAGFAMGLAGRTIGLLGDTPRRLRPLLDQMFLSGIKGFHVVLLVSFFVGMIVSLQVGLELARFGQQEAIGLLVAVTMAREMGPFITAIILAASSASAMAAELGTMKVQEELTALEVLSVNSVSYLVLPRVIALTLIAPMLTIVADFVGIMGGGVIAVTQLHLDFDGYLLKVVEALRITGDFIPLPRDLFVGLVKSVFFGFTIAVVGCASGMQASEGARGVGRTTRAAVRNSIILIIVLNYFLSRFLLE
jgi:phospholipid/cholesterol/gamma-HCH transport system permease protein